VALLPSAGIRIHQARPASRGDPCDRIGEPVRWAQTRNPKPKTKRPGPIPPTRT